MEIVQKAALGTVSPGDDEGSFEIVLSTGTKDRDGEEVKPEEWEQPLPEHITMDADHGMTAEKTVGSGKPTIEDGKMIVRGRWAKTPLAENIRSLVNDGHIKTTSVAFLRKTSVDQKSGNKVVTRELLNGAFVAVPANPEAVVLSSKAGARNNQSDAKTIQAIHDHAAALGATCEGQDGKSAKAVTDQSWDGSASRFSIEQWKSSTLIGPLGDPQSKSSYKLPVKEPNGDINSNAVHAAAAALAGGRGGVDAPGPEKAAAAKKLVGIYRQLKADPPDSLLKLAGAKAFLPDVTRKSEDPSALIAAIDASLDEACNQLGKVDLDSLPFQVQQALALVTSAGATVDHLMSLCGITDPDHADDDPSTPKVSSDETDQDDNESKPAAKPAAEKAANGSAAVDSVSESELQNQLSHIKIMAQIYRSSE